ncbi:MAG: CHAT domain-containing protein/tetratricopeptide (TPR) repeat protein [Planctomycetota bacterium]|jgi:CHAT domain-containing protein/tetratricopeptide (TPR) repeat protein
MLAAFLFAFATYADVPFDLDPGKPVEARVDEVASAVRTAALDAAFARTPVVGVDYRVVVDASGVYHFDLRSYDFDAYLVLRDADGRVLAEADDGLGYTHARVITELEPGVDYRLTACALHGQRGDFELRLTAGKPPELAPDEWARLEIDEARTALSHAEVKYGPDELEAAAACTLLANLLRGKGEHVQSLSYFERALAITEERQGPEHLDTAYSLNQLAVALRTLGNHDRALPLFERALASKVAQLEPGHAEIGAAHFNLASVLKSMGAFTRAKPHFEAALVIHEARLGETHDLSLRNRNVLGVVCFSSGDYERARQVFERLVEIHEARYGDHPTTASSLNTLAEVLNELGRHDEARTLLEHSLAIYEEQLGSDHQSTGQILSNLALLLANTGELEAALPLAVRGLAAFERSLGPDDPSTASSAHILATVLFDAGEFERALPLYERVLASLEAAYGIGHLKTGLTLSNLSVIHHAMGALDEAASLARRSLEIHEAQLGPNHLNTAMSQTNLAFALVSAGQYSEARPLYDRALHSLETQLGPDHHHVASCLANIGQLHGLLHEVEHARAAYLRALTIIEGSLGPDHPNAARCHRDIGALLWRAGDYEGARTRLERANEIHSGQLGSEHPSTSSGLASLGALLLDLGEPDEAWEIFRAAQAGMRARLPALLALRTRSDGQRYLATRRRELELALSVPRCHSTPAIEAAAASNLLAWKGQVGRAACAVRGLMRGSDAARGVAARLRERQDELARVAFETHHPIDARMERIARLKDEIEDLELELRDMVGLDGLSALDVEALLARLPEDAAFLMFFIQRIYAPAPRVDGVVGARIGLGQPHLVAWVGRRGRDVVSVDLGPAAPLRALTQDFLRGFTGQDAGAPERGLGLPAERADRNEALRAALWEPIAPALEGATLIVVSHDDFTATLPFEVVEGADGRYLVEDRAFAYLHDLQVIGDFATDTSRTYDSFLGVGGVDYGAPPPGATAAWSALDGTATEVRSIVELHGELVADGARVSLEETDATEARVLSELPNASLVHVATHGFFQRDDAQPAPDQPRASRRGRALVLERSESRAAGPAADVSVYLPEVRSGLVLAGANHELEGAEGDGYLTAADLEWIDLSGAELITLSACETGLGRPESGEGMTGFRSTLLRTGVRTVVTSLWTIPDDSTQRLMTRFYEHLLRDGMGPLEALRSAQLWMLATNRRVHGEGRPYTWGAFVLSGDWR